MGKVIFFPEKTIQQLRGPARCLSCRHEWEAVSPEGVCTSLECPSCGLLHGVLQGVCEPGDGVRFVCNCGCDLFYILPLALQCLMCGTEAKGF